jgi:hypothetical protein
MPASYAAWDLEILRDVKKTFGAGRPSVAALTTAPAALPFRARPEAGTRGGGHGATSALLSRVSPGRLSPGPA